MFNTKGAIEAMLRAGWAPETFAAALNSVIKTEKQLKRKHPMEAEDVTVEQARIFLEKKGLGFSGDQLDVFERWAVRHLGQSGYGNHDEYFSKPGNEVQTLRVNAPPVVVDFSEFKEAENGSVVFKDITNERERRRIITEGVHS
jgi:hypothetical protein